LYSIQSQNDSYCNPSNDDIEEMMVSRLLRYGCQREVFAVLRDATNAMNEAVVSVSDRLSRGAEHNKSLEGIKTVCLSAGCHDKYAGGRV
jgi:histone H3/H4